MVVVALCARRAPGCYSLQQTLSEGRVQHAAHPRCLRTCGNVTKMEPEGERRLAGRPHHDVREPAQQKFFLAEKTHVPNHCS